MHKFKWQQRTKRFILVLMSLLTLVSILMTGVRSYAVSPNVPFAYIVNFQGNGLTLGTGNIRNRQPVNRKDKLEDGKTLYVPGGNKPWAHLAFAVDYPKDFAQFIVKAGPHNNISEWSFPCTARGGFTISWKRGDDRGCEAGVKVQSSSKRGGLPNNNLQASRKLLAQAEDEVTVVPTPRESLIQTADTATGIKIDVLVGDVRVKSAKNPDGRLVKAGERYDYPQDTITPIDPNPILNSPEVQDFLNPNNWQSPDIPERVANGIAGQLGELRTALGQSTPVVASNSGNNNPSRTPTASNTSNNNNDLCGSGIITRRIVYSETSAGRIPYSMWLDYTHGSDMGHPNCGRVHYDGYGSRSVLLVDGKGACVVTTPFEENPDGSLNSVPGKYNDCPIGFIPLPPSLVLSNPQPSQPGVNLNGEWSFQYIGTPGMWTTPITQNGNRIEMLQSFDGGMQKVEGTVSENQIRVIFLGLNGGLVGTISEDGNTIKGLLLPLPTSRDKKDIQFRMQRIR